MWHTLEDDGYIYANLSWHLEQAQRLEDLHQLLQEETKTGHNGWYEACDRLGQNGIFVTDVARAWRLAEDMYSEKSSDSISLQCFYALITASLNSLAANLPNDLLIALVNKKVWTPNQGLAYALQSSNPSQKADSLTALANHLPPNLEKLALEKALAAAKQIQDEESRARVLGTLAIPLSKLPATLLYSYWKQTLYDLSLRTRQNLLSDIENLVPVIFALGNDAAIASISCAIQKVARWWP